MQSDHALLHQGVELGLAEPGMALQHRPAVLAQQRRGAPGAQALAVLLDGQAALALRAGELAFDIDVEVRAAARVKVVVASFKQPAAAYPLLWSAPRRPNRARD